MKKCQFISNQPRFILQNGKYYYYDLVEYHIIFPYHIYDESGIVDLVNEADFLKNFIDLSELRKQKLDKISQTR